MDEDTTLFEISDFGDDFMEEALGWDIAFQRNHVKTNSGTSGVGNAGVYIDSIEIWNGTIFNNLVDIEDDFEYSTDTIINTFYDTYTHNFSSGSSNASLETWAKIDTTNNYTMTISYNKFIVRTANGQSFYKFWPFDYYDENSNSGNVSLIYNLICTLDDCGVCGGNATDPDECED